MLMLKVKPKGNGICCPRCSSELIDTAKLSDGIRKEVSCLICDYASIFNTRTLKLEKNF
jgi:hypothetical protein